MSLIDDMMEEITVMNKIKVADGEGGFVTEYVEGVVIQATITRDTTMQTRIAEKEGVTSVYTVWTKRNVVLDYHDVLKKTDGSIYRVTSKGDEVKTPKTAGLDLAQVSAESWSLE